MVDFSGHTKIAAATGEGRSEERTVVPECKACALPTSKKSTMTTGWGRRRPRPGHPGDHGRLLRPHQDRRRHRGRGAPMSSPATPTVTVIGCDGRPLGPEAATALAAADRVA